MRKEAYFIVITDMKLNETSQYLKLSEINLLPSILRENKSVTIESVQITETQYKLIFNL